MIVLRKKGGAARIFDTQFQAERRSLKAASKSHGRGRQLSQVRRMSSLIQVKVI